MDFTQEEQKLLRPYLRMKVKDGRGWLVGVAVGVLICAATIVVSLTGVWRQPGPYFLFAIVVGLVVIEQSIDHRDQTRLARVLQKYDAALKERQEAQGREPTR